MSARRAGSAALATLVLLVAVPRSGRAQQPRIPVVREIRVDALGGRPSSVQGGLGLQIPSGTYVRVGVLAGAGATLEREGASRAAGRVDVLARFLLDPFRQARWGISAGAGVSLRADPGDRARPRLFAAIDVEGRRMQNGFTPALQIGLGGGVRGGVALRWGGRSAR